MLVLHYSELWWSDTFAEDVFKTTKKAITENITVLHGA